MKKIFFLILYFSAMLYSQDFISGVIVEKNDTGTFSPMIGASVFWLGTSSGTITDTSGVFKLKFSRQTNRLVVNYVGYIADTLTIVEQRKVHIILKSDAKKVAEVEVVAEKQTTYVNYLAPNKTLVMTEKELFKAACCNLSESFETNPSIDVSFTDAITGTKQIEMLGLAGTYSQITTEALPIIRGLTSTAGLTYFPGTWIESIQVSKGVGSVANGYESITGQINVELRKPQNEDEKKIFLNFFGNQDQRMEANLNFRQALIDNVESMTLLHASMQQQKIDGNGDNFLDAPLYKTINALQRFHYTNHIGWEGQFGIQFVQDEKQGGTKRGYNFSRIELQNNPSEYAFSMNGDQLRLFGKTGYVFQQKQYQSIGLQWSLVRNRQYSSFPMHDYSGYEQSGYVNLIYQSIFDNTMHKFRTGLSFLFDDYDETFASAQYKRIERVPGTFFEYTYSPDDEFSLVAGIRADKHNLYGTFFTPRLHMRYTPQEDWVFRIVAGRGKRTANIFVENMAYFASARHISVIKNSADGAYGLDAEIAWNFGFNVTHHFLWDYREATFGIDIYRTQFESQVVTDLDKNPQHAAFYSLNGESYSNSIQIELNMQPIEQLDMRIAYRFLDVKQIINNKLRERPFVAKHRAFINFGYSTKRETNDDAQMQYDFTLQWFGQKRLPDTQLNPILLQTKNYSPGFVLANTQITRSFFAGFDVYLGIENIFNFKQANPILDSANPNGKYFDSSLIWGPIYGRTAYVGLRYRM